MSALTRREFLYTSALLTLPASKTFGSTKSSNGDLMLAGTQTSGTSKGIYAYRFDSTSGELTPIGLAAAADNPTFLVTSSNRRTIVAANEVESFEGKSGAVSSFALDPSTGILRKISEVTSNGGSPCHVAIDKNGSAAFAANYTGGSAVSYRLDSHGVLSPPVSFFQYQGHGPDASRQTSAHAHRVTVSPENKYLLVNDLGLDQIHIYRLDTAKASLAENRISSWNAPAGSGPRALQFHPAGRYAYCICELTSQIIVLSWNAAAGELATVQEISLPIQPHDGPSTGDDVVLDRQARFAYVTNRGDDFVATLSVSPGGDRLTFLQRSSCGGKTPRHLALDPSQRWLLIANQNSDSIVVFSRDPKTGQLSETAKSFPISIPQCLVFPLS